LRFGRLHKRTEKNTNNKDDDGDEGFLHGLYSPLYVTMMQWFHKGPGYRNLR
jgi:hypothetical protein